MARAFLNVMLLLVAFLGSNHCEEDFNLDERPTRPPETEGMNLETLHRQFEKDKT